MKERYYIEAAGEYLKRLGAYCKVTVTEIPESFAGKDPSAAGIASVLDQEYAKMNIPARSAVIALCIEGVKMTSEAFSQKLQDFANRGASRIVFVIGGSNGLAEAARRPVPVHVRYDLSASSGAGNAA